MNRHLIHDECQRVTYSVQCPKKQQLAPQKECRRNQSVCPTATSVSCMSFSESAASCLSIFLCLFFKIHCLFYQRMSSIKGTLPDDDEKARTMIIQHLKSQGIFDAMRRECLADIDTKVSQTCCLLMLLLTDSFRLYSQHLLT